MAASWANEASSSSSTAQRKYDVFLSFSGIDTRLKFTSHLFAALERHGFYTFRDDTKLNRGEHIGSELLKAIEESSISIIVFSKNYAMSRWCLDELVQIMKCRKTFNQIILPIFYDVDPSDVRGQKGSLAEAFAKHEEHFRKSLDCKVEKWRAALTEAANLSGWDLNVYNGDEAKLIAKIIEEVGNVIDLEHLSVADHPVGLEDRVQKLRMLLRMESNDNVVRIVAVWGIGGLGKTTIAKNLYKLIHRRFDGSSFLANVRETWKKSNGLLKLQEQLLSDIFKNEIHHIRNIHQGKEVIIRRALHRKVLLVLDDVDDIKQLKELAIDRAYFGYGSRIIITTRDLSSLNFEVDEIYTPEELDEDKSFQLFSWHAFKEDHPIENYVKLSKQVVDYARGLPLALEILGCFLSRIISIPEWESVIEKLKKIPHKGIQEKLEISYNSLSKEVKELFLDIACFFVGMDRNFIIKILKGCKLFPEIGLRILFDRCLIKYGPGNKLVMHDNDLCTLPDSIGNLTRLQILNMAYCNVSYLSSEIGNLISLTDLDLGGNDLCALPDSIGNLTRLQSLNMEGCNVSHLPSEIGSLISLRDLDLAENNLRSLPNSVGNLTCLTFLAISNCNVSYLPSEIGSLISLTGLFLDGNNFCTLPDSFCNLTRLDCLHMTNCNVSYLPSEIGSLILLKELVLDGNNLCTLPDSVGELYRLIELRMNNCNLSHMPSAIWRLMGLSLESLYLKGCHKLAESNFVYNVMKAAIWQVKDYRMFHPIHGFVDHSEIYLTWGEVPRWFEYQTEGSSLSVKVPPLVNQKIWSLAVCVIYIGSNSNEKCNQQDFFYLEYHINKVQRRSYLIGDCGDGLCREDQMFLKFTSMSELEGGDEVEIFITKCRHIQVKKCAAKLI